MTTELTIKQVNLTTIHRQAANSAIIVNAHRINAGNSDLKMADDFIYIHRPDPAAAYEYILDEIIEKNYNADKNSIDDIQVLASHYRGACGVDALNKGIQQATNPFIRNSPPDEILNVNFIKFAPGDRVMHIKNNYNLQVMNGEIGTVDKYDKIDKILHVIFDDNRKVPYELADVNQLRLSYACTIHKSQGCEFPIVVVAAASDTPFPLRQRALLYTAVTRARKKCIIVGDIMVINQMIRNGSQQLRMTKLAERVKSAL